MPKSKANKGTFTKDRPGPGRPKGVPNKTTIAAKEAFSLAFDELGGWEGLAQWANASPANKTEFYKLYGRLIPIDVKADVQAHITVNDDIPPK